MNEQEQLIRTFYTGFQQLDWESMAACYHNEVIFYDPIFECLEGEQAKAMWEMLLKNARGLQLSFGNIVPDENYCSCDWTASYTFSQTGRRVVNKVKAHFKFEDGRIIEHQDSYDLWKWSRQALGVPGTLLGWTPFLHLKIRRMAKKKP
jgi:hypothetical protein